MPAKGKGRNGPGKAAPPPEAPTRAWGCARNVGEALRIDGRSGLGSEMDQIGEDSDGDSDSDLEPVVTLGDKWRETVVFLLGMTPRDSTHQDYDHWRFLVRSLGVLATKWHDIDQAIPSGLGPSVTRHLGRVNPPKPATSNATTQTPPPSKPVETSVATQTARPSATSDAATDPPPAPPARTYAEAATQATVPKREQSRYQPPASPGKPGGTIPPQSKGKGKSGVGWCPNGHREPKEGNLWVYQTRGLEKRGSTSPRARPPASSAAEESPQPTRTLVMHAAPLKYKPGTMRRWIEGDNRGVKILGIRWLLKEDRRGQGVSSLVIYMKDLVEVTKLRMGRRLFRTTAYDWDR